MNIPKPTKKSGLITKWKEQDNIIVKAGGWQANDYVSDGYDGIPLEDRRSTGEVEGSVGEPTTEAAAAYPLEDNGGYASEVDEAQGEVQVGMRGIDSRKRKRREPGETRTNKGPKLGMDTFIDGVTEMGELDVSSGKDDPSAIRQVARAPRNIRMTTASPSERPRSKVRKTSRVDQSRSLRAERSNIRRDSSSKIVESSTPVPAPHGMSLGQPISSGDHPFPHSPQKRRDDTTSPHVSPKHTAKRRPPKSEASHVEGWYIRGSERSHGPMPMSDIQAAIILYEMSRSRV